MNCKNNNPELIFATTDKNLYDNTNQKWLYNFYVSIQCIYEKQYNVSDLVLPNIKPNEYMRIDKNPEIWNYCKNLPCKNKKPINFLIVFTLNPESKNPKDYLKFVFNIFGEITDIPSNSIKLNDNDIYLKMNLSTSYKNNFIEIWLTMDTIPTFFQIKEYFFK